MKNQRKAFTLIELLVVISIIAVLLGLLFPALSKARIQARKLLSANNLKQVAAAAILYDCDNGRFMPSVAYIGSGYLQTWLEPTALKNYEFVGPRSTGSYLDSYIENANTITCPSAPAEYEHLQDAWDAGDQWDNPDTDRKNDPLFGTYSTWWNYKGYLSDKGRIFQGPSRADASNRQSTLLASCTFGTTPNPYNQLDYGDYISCEKFNTASKTPEYSVASQMWNQLDSKGISRTDLKVNLNAAHIDGHVGQFSASDTTTLKVSMKPDGGLPYFSADFRGSLFLPALATGR